MGKKRLDTLKRVTKKGVFPHQYAFTLLIPLRNIFLSPKRLVDRLQLEDNHIVLEVGSGPGYFSSEVAKNIPKGRLILTDIQSEMLDIAKKRLSKKGVTNVLYHLSNGIDFPFEDDGFDRIYMVTVLGEVENQEQYIKEFYRILRPGGILSISEQFGDADKMSTGEIKDLICGLGFKVSDFYGNKRNFTINFMKKIKGLEI